MWKIVEMDEKNCDPQKIQSQEIGVEKSEEISYWKKF